MISLCRSGNSDSGMNTFPVVKWSWAFWPLILVFPPEIQTFLHGPFSCLPQPWFFPTCSPKASNQNLGPLPANRAEGVALTSCRLTPPPYLAPLPVALVVELFPDIIWVGCPGALCMHVAPAPHSSHFIPAQWLQASVRPEMTHSLLLAMT